MGGNALKNTSVKTRRYDAEEYHEAVEQVLCYFRSSNLTIDAVQAYREKESFGDIDVVTLDYDGVRPYVEHLLAEAGVTEIVKNTNIWSCGWEGTDGSFIQLDLIFHKEDIYSTALNYYAWNDLGNFIGRVADNLGLKYGHRGLLYTLRDGDTKIGEYLITNNTHEALGLLGFCPERFAEGFNTLEEIFEYVASSKYFKKEFYPLEHRSHRARVRDEKRPNYNALLEWIDNKKPEDGEDLGKGSALLRCLAKYPLFNKKVLAAYAQNEKRKIVKAKFNGKIVSELTGLKGEELGKFMQRLKLLPHFWQEELLLLGPEEIALNILGIYKLSS